MKLNLSIDLTEEQSKAFVEGRLRINPKLHIYSHEEITNYQNKEHVDNSIQNTEILELKNKISELGVKVRKLKKQNYIKLSPRNGILERRGAW